MSRNTLFFPQKSKDLFRSPPVEPVFQTEHGALFNADCLKLLPHVRDDAFDMVFADPPFNLSKDYGKKINDNLKEEEYLEWCKQWIDECIRTLKPGGSFFLYNIPKWNVQLGTHLSSRGLLFRHWIAVNIKFSLPIQGRLYPSHYSLLYYSKGKPKTFRKIRTAIALCRHCGKEVKDYGGHRNALNPRGINLTDVWDDIPPVRHKKFKSDLRTANQLSSKLLWRVIQMSTEKQDLIFDPFGGSGTTYSVAEELGRNWIGTELGSCESIISRMRDNTVCHHAVTDIIDE